MRSFSLYHNAEFEEVEGKPPSLSQSTIHDAHIVQRDTCVQLGMHFLRLLDTYSSDQIELCIKQGVQSVRNEKRSKTDHQLFDNAVKGDSTFIAYVMGLGINALSKERAIPPQTIIEQMVGPINKAEKLDFSPHAELTNKQFTETIYKVFGMMMNYGFAQWQQLTQQIAQEQKNVNVVLGNNFVPMKLPDLLALTEEEVKNILDSGYRLPGIDDLGLQMYGQWKGMMPMEWILHMTGYTQHQGFTKRKEEEIMHQLVVVSQEQRHGVQEIMKQYGFVHSQPILHVAFDNKIKKYGIKVKEQKQKVAVLGAPIWGSKMAELLELGSSKTSIDANQLIESLYNYSRMRQDRVKTHVVSYGVHPENQKNRNVVYKRMNQIEKTVCGSDGGGILPLSILLDQSNDQNHELDVLLLRQYIKQSAPAMPMPISRILVKEVGYGLFADQFACRQRAQPSVVAHETDCLRQIALNETYFCTLTFTQQQIIVFKTFRREADNVVVPLWENVCYPDDEQGVGITQSCVAPFWHQQMMLGPRHHQRETTGGSHEIKKTSANEGNKYIGYIQGMQFLQRMHCLHDARRVENLFALAAQLHITGASSGGGIVSPKTYPTLFPEMWYAPTQPITIGSGELMRKRSGTMSLSTVWKYDRGNKLPDSCLTLLPFLSKQQFITLLEKTDSIQLEEAYILLQKNYQQLTGRQEHTLDAYLEQCTDFLARLNKQYTSLIHISALSLKDLLETRQSADDGNNKKNQKQSVRQKGSGTGVDNKADLLSLDQIELYTQYIDRLEHAMQGQGVTDVALLYNALKNSVLETTMLIVQGTRKEEQMHQLKAWYNDARDIVGFGDEVRQIMIKWQLLNKRYSTKKNFEQIESRDQLALLLHKYTALMSRDEDTLIIKQGILEQIQILVNAFSGLTLKPWEIGTRMQTMIESMVKKQFLQHMSELDKRIVNHLAFTSLKTEIESKIGRITKSAPKKQVKKQNDYTEKSLTKKYKAEFGRDNVFHDFHILRSKIFPRIKSIKKKMNAAVSIKRSVTEKLGLNQMPEGLVEKTFRQLQQLRLYRDVFDEQVVFLDSAVQVYQLFLEGIKKNDAFPIEQFTQMREVAQQNLVIAKQYLSSYQATRERLTDTIKGFNSLIVKIQRTVPTINKKKLIHSKLTGAIGDVDLLQQCAMLLDKVTGYDLDEQVASIGGDRDSTLCDDLQNFGKFVAGYIALLDKELKIVDVKIREQVAHEIRLVTKAKQFEEQQLEELGDIYQTIQGLNHLHYNDETLQYIHDILAQKIESYKKTNHDYLATQIIGYNKEKFDIAQVEELSQLVAVYRKYRKLYKQAKEGIYTIALCLTDWYMQHHAVTHLVQSMHNNLLPLAKVLYLRNSEVKGIDNIIDEPDFYRDLFNKKLIGTIHLLSQEKYLALLLWLMSQDTLHYTQKIETLKKITSFNEINESDLYFLQLLDLAGIVQGLTGTTTILPQFTAIYTQFPHLQSMLEHIVDLYSLQEHTKKVNTILYQTIQ